MRHRLMQMLKLDDRDDATDAIVQSFWSRAKPRCVLGPAANDAKVVDLARWARLRGRMAHP